jgi:RimJ/RimL family protein N-acetyltransferase
MLVRMGEWRAPTLEGRIVRLEPMREDHAEGLWDASRDARTWTWMPIVQPASRPDLDRWLADALAAAAAGTDLPLVTLSAVDGRVLGSTRYLALRPEHRSVEIGWTWLHPDAWGTGANVEAKLLMLGHAFDTWGCRRVELKTDALNERSRAAIEALGASFEGIHRQHLLVRGGENRDSAWYSILDREWPAARRSLGDRLAQH